MRSRGFTIIEVIIVIVIIGILLSLGTVQLLSTQRVARDKERADDITTIRLVLEDIYDSGQYDGKIIPSGLFSTATEAAPLSYPSTAMISRLLPPNVSPFDIQAQALIEAIGTEAIKSPYSTGTTYPYELKAAIDATGIVSGKAGGVTINGKTNDVYVFQPLNDDGSLCGTAGGDDDNDVIAPRVGSYCVSYKLYYFSEADDRIIETKSKRTSSDGLY